MDNGPLIMMGLIGIAAGWIANLLLGRGGDIGSHLITGVIGAYVGAFIQRHAQLDLMKLGNPLLEELAVAIIGSIVVILVARAIVQPSNR